MAFGYGSHSNRPATHSDETSCSHVYPHILLEKFLPISPVLEAGLRGKNWEREMWAEGLPKGRDEGSRQIQFLHIKVKEHKDQDGKTWINSSE